jgi:hypothetical protein
MKRANSAEIEAQREAFGFYKALDRLDLSKRVRAIIAGSDCVTIAEVVERGATYWRWYPGVGKTALEELTRVGLLPAANDHGLAGAERRWSA